jgi:nucleoside-diphosphate-sugar epimerase
MKILITGSTGFLGNVIKKSLINDFEIFEYTDSKNKSIKLELDIPLFKHQFDLVIHAAGKAHLTPKDEIEVQQFYSVNVKGTYNLLKGLEFIGLPKEFVFISTVAVYGNDYGINISESEKLKACDPYGLSKIQAEKLISDWCNKNNIICTILRLPLVVGPNSPGNLEVMIKGIKKGYYFNVEKGKVKKSMVLAEDVAGSILAVSKLGGIYNLTDGYHPSFAELSNLICIQLHKKKPLNIPIWLAKIIAKVGDLLGSKVPFNTNKLKKITSDLTFDDSKARQVLGWNPSSVLDYYKK